MLPLKIYSLWNGSYLISTSSACARVFLGPLNNLGKLYEGESVWWPVVRIQRNPVSRKGYLAEL